MQENEITCTAFKQVNKGVLIGFANIYIPKWGVEIFGVSLFEKNGKRWISMPSREYEDKTDGKKKYMPHIRFREKSHGDLFASKVMDAIVKFCGECPRQDSIFEQEGLF